jgi:hypothetical protein
MQFENRHMSATYDRLNLGLPLRREGQHNPFVLGDRAPIPRMYHLCTPSHLLVAVVIRWRGQDLLDPSLMLIGQRPHWQLTAFSRSSKIVAGSDGNAGEPSIEGDQDRELPQTEIFCHKYIVDDLVDLINRHSPSDSAYHMA